MALYIVGEGELYEVSMIHSKQQGSVRSPVGRCSRQREENPLNVVGAMEGDGGVCCPSPAVINTQSLFSSNPDCLEQSGWKHLAGAAHQAESPVADTLVSPHTPSDQPLI